MKSPACSLELPVIGKETLTPDWKVPAMQPLHAAELLAPASKQTAYDESTRIDEQGTLGHKVAIRPEEEGQKNISLFK